MGYQWYIMEIATLFFAMGIFSGIAMNYTPNKITKHFLEGVKDILSAALVVGLAGVSLSSSRTEKSWIPYFMDWQAV